MTDFDCYGIIYKTTNLINGNIYVGQTINKGIFLEKYLGSGKLITYAIKKYGKHNFQKEIICKCNSYEQLNRMEKLWIKILKPEYNIAEGGHLIKKGSNPSNDPLVRQKISNTLKGRKLPPEHVEAIRRGLIGRKHSEDSKNRIKQKNLETYMNKNRFVICNYEDQVFVFYSISNASRHFNITKNYVCSCLKYPQRKRRKNLNMFFRYATEEEKQEYLYNYYKSKGEKL